MKIYRLSNTKSDQFKQWFGDWEDPNAFSSKRDKSKSTPSYGVSDKGEPQTFYHGTLKNFQEFDVGREGTNSDIFGSWNTNRHAVFFTPNPKHANTFTTQGEETVGGNVIPVYLDIKSPLDLRKGIDDSTLNEFSGVGINWKWMLHFHWDHFDGDDGKRFVEAAKKLGYDGVIFFDEDPSSRESMETWAVFDPSQIKSAIGNIGTYDRIKRDINASTVRLAGIPRRGPYLYGLLKETGPVAVRLTQEEWDQNPTHGQFFGDAWMRGVRWTYDASQKQLQFMMTPESEEYEEIRTWVENNGFLVNGVVHLEGGGFKGYDPMADNEPNR